MRVYVVETGNETDIDYDVVSVHRSKANAVRRAPEQPCPLEGFSWVRDSEDIWIGRARTDNSITFGLLEVSEFELED